MARARTSRSPALLASALAHVAVVAAALISWPWLMHPVELGKIVPVTLVTSGPPAELAPATKAPEPQPAMAPAPTPEAPPQPAPISSSPPTPPAPAATPKPAQSTKPTPSATSKPKTVNGCTGDFFTCLAHDLQPDKPTSTRETSGQPGQNRSKTAPVPQTGSGPDDHLSANEIQALGDKLGKQWNPNCQVLGSTDVNIKVRMQLTPQGFVVKKQVVNEAEIRASNNPVLVAAADRALSAVGRGEPYTDVLDPAHYADWRDIQVNFNAKQVCSKQ